MRQRTPVQLGRSDRIGLASEAALHESGRIRTDDPFPAFPALTAIFRLNDRNAGESCEAPDADA